MAEFSDLVGQTITSIEGLKIGSGEVVITTAEGRIYEMSHSQDCCEQVLVAEIHGDEDDALGFVLSAKECVNPSDAPKTDPLESSTWTFYRLQTNKGLLVIRWLGESNGYYSESVYFTEKGKGNRWD